jgi:cytochrome b561
MTENSELAEGSRIDIAAGADRFDQMSISLHWLTVFLIVIQFASVWSLRFVDEHGRVGMIILDMHRSSGLLMWFVTVVRLVWRHNFAYLPPFPDSMPKLQQTFAKASEYSLYVVLLIQPITGLGRSLLRGRPFDLFFWQVPAFRENDPIRHLFGEAHEIGAKLLLALISIHVGAALFHRLVLRDGVLQRMLPRLPARTSLSPTLAKSDAE